MIRSPFLFLLSLPSHCPAGCIRVWDLTANRCWLEMQPESETPLSSITIAGDASLLAAASYTGDVHLYSPKPSGESYTHLRSIRAHAAYILSCRRE